ncbi:hypothetical protein GGR56DRAFT_679029 [Xylariaceae sp. FL0804]|nr:hypothetical protein GGR56DRAFT_679029 [Xylariaceae sp. FL0804]
MEAGMGETNRTVTVRSALLAGKYEWLCTSFHAGVSSTPDDSGFQFTIHSGWDQFYARAFNNVYVLNIPSFRWIRVDDEICSLSPGTSGDQSSA